MFNLNSSIFVSNRAQTRAVLNYFGITPFFQPGSDGIAPCQRKRVKQRGSNRYVSHKRNRNAFDRAKTAVVDSAVAAVAAVTNVAPAKSAVKWFRGIRNFFAKILRYLIGFSFSVRRPAVS